MLTLRPAAERGHGNYGWLNTHYSFSFANYYDPKHMGFRALRVINDDEVEAGQGFGTHSHKDMEILTYVLEGAIEHQDSLGSGDILRPGEVQHMSAGTGIYHSEFNPSSEEKLHLLQVWLLPTKNGIPPNYDQKKFPVLEQRDRLHLVASPDARDGSLAIVSEADMYAGKLDPGTVIEHRLTRPHAWLQVAAGKVTLNGQALIQGDGVAISDEAVLKLEVSTEGAELLLFELD